MAHLATLFAQLPGPHARRDALDAIVGNLSTHEWRHLVEKLQKRSFAKDIVGSLPVELVALVFAHLPLNAPFLYQTVSRRWRDVLSSSHVISSSLAQWYSDADPKLQGEIQGAVQDVYATQSLKAEHAWRFQHKRPFSHRRYTYSSSMRSYRDFDAACVGDNMCWLDGDAGDRLLRLCNLRTSDMTAIAGEAREFIVMFSLSTKIVALLALGGCYVYNFQSREKSYFRLLRCGSDTTMALATHENTVAVAYYKYPRLEADMYLHNTQEHRTRHFHAKVPAPPDAPKKLALTTVLLNNDRDMVTLFFMVPRLDRPDDDGYPNYTGLYCVSYSFSGERLESDSASRLADGNSQQRFLKTPRAVDYTNRIQVIMGCDDRRQSTLIYFDNHVGRFTRQVVCGQNWSSQPSPVFMWKGIGGHCGPWIKERKHCPQIADCEICTSRQLDDSDTYSNDKGLVTHYDDSNAYLVDEFRIVDGNECFLVAFGDEFCTVYCFDKHVELPDDIVPKQLLPVEL